MGIWGSKQRYDELFQDFCDVSDAKFKLAIENQQLRDYKAVVEALVKLSRNGVQIIGIEEKDGIYYASVIQNVKANEDVKKSYKYNIYFMRLPETNLARHLGIMTTEILHNCSVHLVDWGVREVDQGFGSIFMRMVIDHYRNTGFQSIVGSTSFVDRDHMDLLLHFYEKFGFTITETDVEFSNRLYLNLRESPRLPKMVNGCEVCIYSSMYSSIDDENSTPQNLTPPEPSNE